MKIRIFTLVASLGRFLVHLFGRRIRTGRGSTRRAGIPGSGFETAARIRGRRWRRSM